jgi:hypothetical protein
MKQQPAKSAAAQSVLVRSEHVVDVRRRFRIASMR